MEQGHDIAGAPERVRDDGAVHERDRGDDLAAFLADEMRAVTELGVVEVRKPVEGMRVARRGRPDGGRLDEPRIVEQVRGVVHGRLLVVRSVGRWCGPAASVAPGISLDVTRAP